LADVPLPRTELKASPQGGAARTGTPGGTHRDLVEPQVPEPVMRLLQTLWSNGHAAYVVGGSLRDALLGREPYDWDLTTDARPDRIQELFPGSIYENRFGTVAIKRDDVEYEITTFRSDHGYADHRRPSHVEFGDSLDEDLARRDFTVNAMAWGAEASRDRTIPSPALADPLGGTADVRSRVLRAVGDPDTRFREDALRMVRAVRLAATLDFSIEPETLAAIRRQAKLARHLSGERIAAELLRLLAADRPSVGFRLMDETGLLDVIAPEFAAQRGILQNKIAGEDLWQHTLRAVDAPGPGRPIVRLAALLHDIGKPATESPDGYPDHEKVGAEMAEAFLARLHVPRSTLQRVSHLVRSHMFTYEPAWSDAAVRRFINRIGPEALDDLFALREADNLGSGLPAETGLTELRRRVREQLEAHVALSLKDLAIDGDDLIRELGLASGPRLGRILQALLDQVIVDSGLNDRPTLLLLAQRMLEDES
jgi:tRNA nucleotidyltransferase (CCA-adding enzyme)